LTTAEQSGVTYLTGLPTGIGVKICSSCGTIFQLTAACTIIREQREQTNGCFGGAKDDPANSSAVFSFYLTWHFPNRRAWAQTRVGNHYAEQYRDAWDWLNERCRNCRLWRKRRFSG
jgi:hypothetical protein